MFEVTLNGRLNQWFIMLDITLNGCLNLWFVMLEVKLNGCLNQWFAMLEVTLNGFPTQWLLENILLPLLLFASNCSKPSEYCIELESLEEVIELDELVAWDEAGVRVGWLFCLFSSKDAIGFRLAPVDARNFFNILSDD